MDITDNLRSLNRAKMEHGIRQDYACNSVPIYIKFCKLKNIANSLTKEEIARLNIKFRATKEEIADYLEISVSAVNEEARVQFQRLSIRDKIWFGKHSDDALKVAFGLLEDGDEIAALKHLI